MKYVFPLMLAAAVSLVCGTALAQKFAEHAPPADGYHALDGTLDVQAPINIAGPFPYVARQVRQGDVILLQIRYPVSPPMPTAVAVTTSHERLKSLAESRASSEVATLKMEPQRGGLIGIGFVQVLLRAVEPGTEQVTVHVKLGNNDVKNVPFAFEVQAAGK